MWSPAPKPPGMNLFRWTHSWPQLTFLLFFIFKTICQTLSYTIKDPDALVCTDLRSGSLAQVKIIVMLVVTLFPTSLYQTQQIGPCCEYIKVEKFFKVCKRGTSFKWQWHCGPAIYTEWVDLNFVLKPLSCDIVL